jgi:hypothetical protein
MLDTAQIEMFKRDGAIVFRAFFLPGEVESWRQQVLQYFGRPEGGEAWRSALRSHTVSNFRLMPDPTPDSHEALSRIYAALYSTPNWAGHNELIVRAGDEIAEWRGPHGPHIDIPIYAPLKTLANSVIYLSTVEQRGGAFMYWPGSHRIAWEYFRQFPEDYMARGERSHQQIFNRLVERMQSEPVEFVGGPGDLLICHSLTLHSASINKQSAERMALFGRWGVLSELPERHDFNADLWNSWRFEKTDDDGGNEALRTPPVNAFDGQVTART